MRLQHAEKTASNLSADTPERENARAVIVAEVDRLHGRIWNGKARDAKVTLERIAKVMPVFQGEPVVEREIRRRAGWGMRCVKSIATWPAKALGWSTTLSATMPVCGSAPR